MLLLMLCIYITGLTFHQTLH